MAELVEITPEQFALEMAKTPKEYTTQQELLEAHEKLIAKQFELSKIPKEFTQQEFLEAYEKLINEMGWKIIANPVFLPTNHGSFELMVQLILTKV